MLPIFETKFNCGYIKFWVFILNSYFSILHLQNCLFIKIVHKIAQYFTLSFEFYEHLIFMDWRIEIFSFLKLII